MIKSSKPRKQRRFRFNAPLHELQHFSHSHVDKALAKKLGITKRAVQVSKGDTIKIMSGKNKGKTGKVMRVSMRKGFLYIDSMKKKNAKGKEFEVPIRINNVYITDLNLSDKFRAGKLKLKVVAQKPAETKAKVSTPDAVPDSSASDAAKPVAEVEKKAEEKAEEVTATN
ncbi:50S ribosomal protein L24P [mine drainage metagenome]|uniref:50S ribosomal protein L24P n=1 Tax=mine drainage metagenome TaxID=410659 RepID=T1BCX5_9ZZZZ